MAAVARISKTSSEYSSTPSRAISTGTSRGRSYKILSSSEQAISRVKEIVLNHKILRRRNASEERVLETLNELQIEQKDPQEKQFLKKLAQEVKAISKVPYERHKLTPVQMVKICLIASSKLQKAIKNSTEKYLKRKKHGLSRSVVLDGKQRTFVILSKKHGKLQAGGTFKSVTDAVEVSTANQIEARRVVCLTNKPDKTVSIREINFHQRYGKILLWLHHQSAKDPMTKKTTIIEEAYDHDLYTFTDYMSPDKQKRISVPELITVLSDIGNTLSKMHEDGVVHQDLKVKNVLYKKDAEGCVQAKVIDFGHSHAPSQTKFTSKSASHRYGTIRYSSPELLDPKMQHRNLFEQRKAEDMYALGCLFYEIFYQKPLPWNADVYGAFKGKSDDKESHRKKGLTLQKTTAESLLRSSTDLPVTPEKQLEWICARLLDPNPKTRITISEFQIALGELEKHSSRKTSNGCFF